MQRLSLTLSLIRTEPQVVLDQLYNADRKVFFQKYLVPNLVMESCLFTHSILYAAFKITVCSSHLVNQHRLDSRPVAHLA